MIKSITILSKSGNESVDFSTHFDKEIGIDCSTILVKSIPAFDIEIVFSVPIVAFRNHDYSWVDIKADNISNSFSPKIIKLANGFYVQANINHGIWEVRKTNPAVLLWRFNPEYSNPLAKYSEDNNQKKVVSATTVFENLAPSLLFSKSGAIELSRSKIPFVATACFTDHCDFDTLENLMKQRIFFKNKNTKVTKGFFLNHFSKRTDNASWENDREELQKWIEDGHELCYHSLSQSIKNDAESNNDFFSFSPPIPITTWIDHGYQPYNLSMYHKEGIADASFSENLASKKISVLWNYIDSGTVTSGVLNQLNTADFTLKSFYNGIKKLSFKKRISLFIKNSIFHFYANEKLIKNYSQLAGSYKKVIQSKSLKSVFSFVSSFFDLALPLFQLVVFWNSNKNKVYPLAKYQAFFFEHTIGAHKFIIFQTIEFLDFINGLDQQSVDKLMEEKGMFIAHTYFSVPMAYHEGKIFTKSGEVHPAVDANFSYLGQNIEKNKIWNPTLNELAAFWIEYNKVELALDENGVICTKNTTEVPYRIII
jgi:hypothetical protein